MDKIKRDEADSARLAQVSEYFRLRGVASVPRIDPHLERLLPPAPDAGVLDIGCGLCDTLRALGSSGYRRLKGIDISDEAVAAGKAFGVDVEKITDIETYASRSREKYDVVVLSHVLEHLEKPAVLGALSAVRERLLTDVGFVYIAVPNAMANTGCYWAYEDFTHTTLFTPGSIHYAVKAAGFGSAQFVDPSNLELLGFSRRLTRRVFLKLYTVNRHFWNLVTESWYHTGLSGVPEIYGYEIRVVARKPATAGLA